MLIYKIHSTKWIITQFLFFASFRIYYSLFINAINWHLIVYTPSLFINDSFFSQWPSNQHPIQQITCFIKNYISSSCQSYLYTNFSSLLIREPVHSCRNKKRNWYQYSNNYINRIEFRMSYSLTLVSIRLNFIQRQIDIILD